RKVAKWSYTPRRWVGAARRSTSRPCLVSTAKTPLASYGTVTRRTSSPVSLHATVQTAQAGLVDEQSLGQLVHAQPTTCLAEVEQDVVPGEREVALGEQLLLEGLGDARMSIEEGPPYRHA